MASLSSETRPCVNSKCNGFMHGFCGIAYNDEEGFGAKRICTSCQDTWCTSVSPSSPLNISSPTTDDSLESLQPIVPTIKNYISTLSTTKKELPTHLKNRDADTIHFNKVILNQIKADGNLYYAIKKSKGTIANYFTYLVIEIIPKIYDPNEFVMIPSGRILKERFYKFKAFAEKKRHRIPFH